MWSRGLPVLGQNVVNQLGGPIASRAVAVAFLVAVAFHLRAGDAEHLPTPALLGLIAAVALALRLASA